jgi:hypothetical protein
LQEYHIDIDITDTEKKTIHVNELDNFLDEITHNGRTKKEGGIRMMGQKIHDYNVGC